MNIINRYKYHRTFHVDFSEGLQNDDRMIKSLDGFIGQEVIVTLKMDGENSTIGQDYTHARSMDSLSHESRTWLKQHANTFQYLIPGNRRVCGENLYAKHTIHYKDLLSYFYGFSYWKETLCLSWDDTLEFFKKASIVPVPVLYRGIFQESILREIANELQRDRNKEGFVCRITGAYDVKDSDKFICKWVRKNHVQTPKHWLNQPIIKNVLKTS